MAWTPPTDAVETTSTGWTPPTDAVETPTQAPSFGGYKSRAGVGRTPSPVVAAEAPASPFGVSSYRAKAPLPEAPPQKTTDKLALLKAAEQKAVQAQIDKVEREKNEFSFKDLSEKPDLFKSINDYAMARHGKDGAMYPNETKDDYVRRWATEMRKIPSDSWEARKERLWLENAKQEDKLKAVKAYDIWKNTANFYSPKGQKGFSPIMDYLISAAGDPFNALSVVTGGTAGIVAKQIAKEGIKGAIKKKLAVAAPVIGVEAGSAAYSAIEGKQIELLGQKAQNVDARSKLEQTKKIAALLPPQEQKEINNSIQQEEKRISESEKKVEEGVTVSDIALPTAIGTLFGTAGTAAALTAKPKGLSLEEVLDTRRSLKQREIRIEPQMDVSVPPPPKVVITPKARTEIQLEDAYDIFEGRKLLDKEGDPTAIAEMQIKNDVNKKAAQIAQNVWKQLPQFAPQEGEKVSDAIKRVFENLDTLDPTTGIKGLGQTPIINESIFKAALEDAGVTAEEFARMNRTTVGDAGRTLQSLSVLSRLQNKLKNIDPAAAKEVDLMYGKRNTLTSAFSSLQNLNLKLDRNIKGLMVSQLATTVRNAYSGLAVVTFGTASEILESSLYRMGKTAYELSNGKPLTGSFTGGLKGVYDDATRTIFYLGQNNLSSDVTEKLLAGTPSLQGLILRTAGENTTTDLHKTVQMINTLNTAQDAFFRKAMFTASVEKQLSRVGINMYDVIEQGKNVPFDVLKNATDEALTGTFSKMPTKGIPFYTVKIIEELGILGSIVVPFPRFMANAISWTFKHGPVGIGLGGADIAKGLGLLRKGDEEGQRYLTRGLENTSKGAVGSFAIYAAYKYREENQDTAWYDIKNPDGSTVDARALFPAAPFLAMGDYIVKFLKGRTDEFKTKEFVEAMAGFKVPAGTTSWLGDTIAEAWSNSQTGEGSADKKLSTFFGELAGQYLGRALVPLQQVSDFIAAVDRDEALPRDAYQIPAGEEGFLSSATKQLQKSVPILKQDLPVYQPATRKEAAFSDAGPLKMFTGIRVKVAPQPLEEEIIKLKIPNNKIFTSTGDKIVDAAARKIMAPLIVDNFKTSFVNTDFYQKASPDEKKIALQNLLAWAQKEAKKIASKTAIAEAFNKGQQARLFAVQYGNLPPEVKRATAEFYKRQTGKDLAETKDYMAALAMTSAIRKISKFAPGGLVKQTAEMLIGKGASKVATKSVVQTADELLQKATEMATKAGVSIPPAAKQTEEVLPVAKQTENLLSQKGTEAVVPAEQQLSGVINKPSKPIKKETKPEIDYLAEYAKYTPEQLQQAESLLKTSMGSQYKLDKLKAESPKDYDKSLLVKLKEVAPEEAATPPTPKDLSIMSPDIVYTPINIEEKKKLSEVSDLNRKTPTNNLVERRTLLHHIREIRQETFPVLVDQLDELSFTKGIKPLDDEVVAVAQGEYRAAKGREVDVDDLTSVEDFASFASKLQDKLDALRIKYKDTPPVVLYHGSRTERTPEKLARGFYDPQTTSQAHAELKIGAISFTKDPNLNYFVEKFGGKEAKNISETTIPYADYEFRRVNMPLDSYEKKDLNYIARTITGSPTVARPLSLPRSQIFKETEDAFVEADKLKITQNLEEVKKKYGMIAKRADAVSDAFRKLEVYNPATIPTKKDLLTSYEAYKNIRTLFNELRKQSDVTSTKTGYGQNYLTSLEKYGPKLINIIDDIQLVFKTQKAMQDSKKPSLLATFKNQLEILTKKQINPITGDLDMATVKEKTKAMNKIQQLTPKLAKGGLASRK